MELLGIVFRSEIELKAHKVSATSSITIDIRQAKEHGGRQTVQLDFEFSDRPAQDNAGASRRGGVQSRAARIATHAPATLRNAVIGGNRCPSPCQTLIATCARLQRE